MTTDTSANATPAIKKGRSPNYPGVDLGLAIERARQMYAVVRQQPINVNPLSELWGYKPTSGQAGIVLAALTKFGLITVEGSGPARRAKLTDDALALIRDEREDSADRDRLIAKMAMLPTVHRELWLHYDGELPTSDAALRFDLMQQRGFTDNGADDFIRQFRSTVALAKLGSSAKLPDESEGDDDEDDQPDPASQIKQRQPERQPERLPERKPGMTVLSFQISDRLVEVAVPGGPLTKDEISMLRDYLTIQERIAPAQLVREAVWRAPDGDVPVRVTGSLGTDAAGRAYVSIEGSQTGIPVDELVESATA